MRLVFYTALLSIAIVIGRSQTFVYRKFKAKKECKIQYQSSCELLDSDDDKESKSESDARNNAIIDSKMDQQKEAPKRKIKTKLNL